MAYIIAAIIFLILQAFFSGIETGLVSLRKPRVKAGVKQNLKGAAILDFFLKNPGYMLGTTLVGVNICIVCASIMAKKGTESLGYTSGQALFVTTLIITLCMLTVEIVPKNWFRQSPYERCMVFSYLLYASYILLYIPVKILDRLTKFVNRKLSSRSKNERNTQILMREDFRLLLRESESANIIDSKAADILDRSIDFYSLTADHIKVDSKVVKSIPSDMTIRQAVEFCRENDMSRVPVYQASRNDDWVGIFSIYQTIFHTPEELWDAYKVTSSISSVNSIRSTSNLRDVLSQIKATRSPMLVVVNEHNHQTGIVTPMDVVKILFPQTL
jgi:putative hemolysin